MGGGSPTQRLSGAERRAARAVLEKSESLLSPEALLQQKLVQALASKSAFVIDLFVEWDENGDGMVSQKEFRRALPLIGLEVNERASENLFLSFDKDGSGKIDINELRAALRTSKQDTATGEGSPTVRERGVRIQKKTVDRHGPKVDTALARVFGESEPEEVSSRHHPFPAATACPSP